MTYAGIIACSIFILALLIFLIVRTHVRKNEMKKYYTAAQRIIQEECLNYAIKNPVNAAAAHPKTQKLMICLKVKGSKQQFVFDPEQGVSIGRNQADNDICLQDVTVSGTHCRLFLYNGQIWIRDLNSANGTWIKHGVRKPEFLQGTQQKLEEKDCIYVGNTVFWLYIFFCDLLSD